MKHIASLVFLSLFSLALVPQSALAVAVGVSPSTIDLVMHEDQTANVHYVLSRSETEGEFRLEVDVSQDPAFVTLSDGAIVTIPEGSNAQTYGLHVETADLDQGKYEAFVNFREANEREDEGMLAIRYGLQAKMNLEVVDRETFVRMLQENPVVLKGVFVDEDMISAGSDMTVHYEVQNPSSLYVDRITNVVGLYNEVGELVYEEEFEEHIDLAPNQNGVFSHAFSIEEPGEYKVSIRTEYDGHSLSESPVPVSVTEKEKAESTVFIVGLVMTGLVILLIVAGILAGQKKKR